MLNKAKAIFFAAAIGISSNAYTPNVNAQQAYHPNEKPFMNVAGLIPSYYTDVQANNYCKWRRQDKEGFWSDGALVVYASGTWYRASKIVNTWAHRNNQQCVISVIP